MADSNEVSLSDSQIESQISSDSGIQTNDSSLEESKIIQTVESHSTPILGNQNKKSEDDNMLARLYDMMCYCVEKQDSNFREVKNQIYDKLDEQKSSFDSKLDMLTNQIYNKLDEHKDELKNEIKEMNKHVESMHETVRTGLNKLEQSVKKLGDNVLSRTNINNDEIMKDVVLNNDNDITYNSENIVGVMYDGETNDENIIKNSTDELVECDNEMLMSVYEVEREWKNNVVIEWVQRADIPLIFYNDDDVLMLFLQGKRPLLVDEVVMLYNVVPYVHNNYESVMWYCEERELGVEREIELYTLKREYDELRERVVIGMNYFDNNYINDNDLPDETTNYLTLNDDTDVDWTINNYGNMMCNGIMDKIKRIGYYDSNNYNNLYVDKNDESYKFIRYIYDDGG